MTAVESKLTRAQFLYREAQEHKRASNRHKRRAREKMELANKFRRELEALGITVIFDEDPLSSSPMPRGGTSDSSS